MEHVALRISERANDIENLLKTVARSLVKRAKEKNLPNCEWYKAVRKDGKVVAYICGKGTSVKTVLAGDMIPHGKEIA